MRISKNRKLADICAKDTSRPALVNPYFDGKRIVATDGKIMIEFQAEDCENDTPGVIPLSILRMSHDGNIELKNDTASTKTKEGVTASITRDAVTYPDIDKVYPPAEMPIRRVAINAKLLYTLVLANMKNTGMDTKHHVILEIPTNADDCAKPIKVSFPGEEDRGIIMPIRLPD